MLASRRLTVAAFSRCCARPDFVNYSLIVKGRIIFVLAEPPTNHKVGGNLRNLVPRKSRQHRVPQVYLRGFCDPTPPVDWPASRLFTPALWVHPPKFDAPPTRRSPLNVAWDRASYNLHDDIPDKPWLEEGFSRLEGFLAPVLDRVRRNEPLSHQDEVWLALFVASQHERTLLITEQRRAFIESVALHSAWFEGADKSVNGEPPDWTRWLPRDLALRQLPTFMSAFANVIAPHAFIIENQTATPLITSDHPVFYGQLHADELVAVGLDAQDMYKQIPRSAREFFVLCPLTPHRVYVASGFFPPTHALRHRALDDERKVIALNEVLRRNAHEEVYASVADPYGAYAPLVHLTLAAEQSAATRMRDSVQIYTEDDRFLLPTSGGRHYDGDHPLHSRYAFTTSDLRALQLVGNADHLIEVTVFEAGLAMAGMRDARFVAVAIDVAGESVVESGPRF